MGESWPWVERPGSTDPPVGDDPTAGDRRPAPDRPGVAPRWAQQVRAWVVWFGAVRLAGTAIAVLAVVAGAWWLLRSPPPPTEAALPYAAGASAPTSVPADTEAEPPMPSVASATTSGPVTVHVAGEVRQPGVYTLPAGALVDDAIEAAGGSTGRADVDAVNLAAPLTDGTQVLVPRPGEVVSPPPGPVASAAPALSADVPGSTPAAPVNVNTATVAELETLPDVGPATATAIVEHREQQGPFATVDDLEQVPGIGPVTLEALKPLVTVT